jgi:Acyl-CoA carboxylase epsilon subunit
VSGPGDPPAHERPLLRVVHGNPDPLELAALVAVISAAQAADHEDEEPEPAVPSQWAAPERLLRTAVHPTGWWASALPR